MREELENLIVNGEMFRADLAALLRALDADGNLVLPGGTRIGTLAELAQLLETNPRRLLVVRGIGRTTIERLADALLYADDEASLDI